MIAAVNGPAVGVEPPQLPMDIRLASENAKFGFGFSRRGIVPEACSSYFLPRVVGISQALEWAYSGRVFQAQEALAGGLRRKRHRMRSCPGPGKSPKLGEHSAISVTLIRHMMWRMPALITPWKRARSIRASTERAEARTRRKGSSFREVPAFTGKPSTDMPGFFPWWDQRDLAKAAPTTHKQKEIAHERCRHCPEGALPRSSRKGKRCFGAAVGAAVSSPSAMAPIRARSHSRGLRGAGR